MYLKGDEWEPEVNEGDTYFRHGDYEFRQSSHDREPMRGVDEMIEDLYKSVNRDPHLKEARDAARVRVMEELASYKQKDIELQ